MNPAINAIGFIFGILFNLYATVVAVRFVMQIVRADYYNPVAQAVVKLTDPLLVPMRRFIPSIKRYDTSSLLLVFIVLLVKLLVFKALSLGGVQAMGSAIRADNLPFLTIVLLSVLDVIHILFNVLIFALIIQAVMSWIPGSYGNPVHSLVSSIGEPVLRPLRRIIPPLGGIDLTVFFTIIGLIALRMFVLGTLAQLLGI
ncbi:MAG: YggT family protein [Granulosicoccus sp.]|nr:YggT family protein [Granulosicoccus sp.]